MAYFPYRIQHLDLHEQLSPPEINAERQGNYLVFWWQQIALGHLYLKPGEPLAKANYYSSLVTAIGPALDFYAAQTPGDWKQLLLEGKYKEWADWMNSMFSSRLPTELPASVPVSVVICTRNRASQLHRCLTLLHNLACAPHEIIVVDNAPTDNTTKDVAEQFARVTYVKEPRPGLDIARNTGVVTANSPIVAFVDDDVMVHPLWVYRVWETFQDPSEVAMTGLVIASELETEAQYTFEKFWSFNRGYKDKIYDQQYFKATLSKGPPVWEIGAGANMAFRKTIFDVVGYFDERLDVGAAGCSGDSEMWFRILNHGYHIHYNPRAVVYHEHRREMAGLKKQLFYYMRGFTTAALVQQTQHQQAGYKQRLYRGMPRHYYKLIIKGFPKYKLRYHTLLVEMGGILSGLVFYYRNRKQHSKP